MALRVIIGILMGLVIGVFTGAVFFGAGLSGLGIGLAIGVGIAGVLVTYASDSD